MVFFGVFVLVLFTFGLSLDGVTPSHSFRDHPHVCSSHKCVSSHLNTWLASYIQCVSDWTGHLLRPVLQCMVPPSIILRPHLSLPLPPLFLTSNPSFSSLPKCPSGSFISILLGHGICCLDYPIAFSLSPLPLRKPSS